MVQEDGSRLVMAHQRRLRFIGRAVLEAWTQGAPLPQSPLPPSRGSTWARDPGQGRPDSRRLRRPPAPPG